MRSLFLLFTALFLVGAKARANPEQAMLAALQALDQRVATIGHRLAVAGTAFCTDAVVRSGFLIHGLVQYRPALRVDASALFDMTERPAILAVVPGSAADIAGLRVGDTIRALNGSALSLPDSKQADYGPIRAVEDRLDAALAAGPTELMVIRNGAQRTVRFAGDRGCASRFQVDPSPALNASADGRYVKLSSRVAEFTASDDELALVIAHELSHNILKHRDKLDAAGVSRGLFRAFGKNPGRIRRTEQEADRLALYLMARAGYDISVTPAFWDRFGRETGMGILSDRTHPDRRARVEQAEADIAAIRKLQATGKALVPTELSTSQTVNPR